MNTIHLHSPASHAPLAGAERESLIDRLRTPVGDDAQYRVPLPVDGEDRLVFRWPRAIDAALSRQIIELMRVTTASAPIIGFAEQIGEAEAQTYLAELRANLASHKCRLLAIFTHSEQLVGLCTLRRNQNPNNRHITDLAKGMIREEYRGGAVLPLAFHEIALQCEADAVEVVTLDVRAGTPAQRVWERFGFQTWGVLPDYARAQGQQHAGHFMMQRVSDLKHHANQAMLQRARRRPHAEVVAP